MEENYKVKTEVVCLLASYASIAAFSKGTVSDRFHPQVSLKTFALSNLTGFSV